MVLTSPAQICVLSYRENGLQALLVPTSMSSDVGCHPSEDRKEMSSGTFNSHNFRIRPSCS